MKIKSRSDSTLGLSDRIYGIKSKTSTSLAIKLKVAGFQNLAGIHFQL